MKKRLYSFLISILAAMCCLPTVAFADAIEDGVYYISNLTTEGYLGLGAYHDVDPYIYYVANESEITEDGWWIVTNTRSGYTFRNQATNQLLVFTTDRVDQYYKYMTLADESLGDHSEYWNIIEGNDGAYCIQSALDTDYYWNLRSGSYMMGTYRGGWGNGWNERYLFHKVGGGDDPDPDQGEHAYVDLGLPSGTLWATCNVGASNPEDYGKYFAWGETTPKKSNGTWGDYSWGTYKWMNQGMADWTQINKYTFADKQTEACWYDSNGTFIGDGQTLLLSEDDAATANWGSEWQMPSLEQMKELIDSENTTSTWTTMNGVHGRLITSNKNNASIFLPAGGRRDGSEPQFEGSHGFYWPNMTDKVYADRACMLTLDANSVSVLGSMDRYCGQSVRPVRVEKKTDDKFPSDQYTAFAFPKALHVYLSDGRVEAYPMMYVTNYSEQGGKLVIETNLNWSYTYNLSEVDSVSMIRPEFPTFDSFKFNNGFNDQLFTTANGEMVEDTVFVTIACIGKRLTPSFKVPADDVEVYAGGVLQTSKESRLRFDKDVYYLLTRSGYKILTPEADNKYFLKPYGRCVRVHVDWLTDRAEVPTIYINTADGLSITSKDYFKDATITIDGHGIFPSMEETAMQIKGRGNSSWGWAKKPYRMKFAEKVKPLGMTKGKNWVLLANGISGSLMTNAIGMKAANLMGASAANHIVPVDLYLNGEYRGSYNLTEKVGLANNSVDLDDETVAALLELDSYYDEPDGQKFRSMPYSLPINIKEPEFAEGTTSLTLEIIQNDFNAFMQTLYKEQDISRHVDLEQLARFLMVNELICNYELYHPKSTFCYKESFEADTCKYIFGPVWDLDWGFGYEQNRTYFKGNTTSNYWTEMPNMEAKQFLQDLRWNYGPLNDIYKQLFKKFLDEDMQELLEYCQDYYDFAHNSFDSNRDIWGDRTNYEQQAIDAANWLETRANKIYKDILDGVRPYKPDPVEPIEFANDKLYTIECRRGELILSYDYKGLEAGQSAWWTVYDFEKQFAIINIGGNNYLYSPYLKKFLKTGTASNGEWVSQLGSPLYFDTSNADGEYVFMISTLTDSGNTLWFNNNTSTIVINTWNKPDDGDRWKIAEVGDFDPTEAIELAQADLMAVTMNIMFDGEVIGSETKMLPYGADMPEPSSDWSNAFVTLKPIGTHPYMVTGETTVDYEAVWTGPFDFSTSFEDAKWYNMTIRSDYMVGKTETEPYYPVVVNNVDTLAMLTFQWAFSGNPYKIKVYNRSTCFDEVLTLDGPSDQSQVNVVMRPGDYSWIIRPNSDGFVLSPPNYLDVCINQFGGSNGALQTWKSNNSHRDNGSTFRVLEAPDPDGISTIDEVQRTTDERIFNLAGQRMNKTQKGVNIIGGKKVIIK